MSISQGLVQRISSSKTLLFRQLFEAESSTFTYLLACANSGHAILIDPVKETVERDSQLIQDLGLTLKYCINTHVHADHITGSGLLKAKFPGTLSAISKYSEAEADVRLQDDDVLSFGDRSVRALYTPGHTQGCLSYLIDDGSMVFTGDTLLIRGCGRTDFQGGSAAALYESVHTKLFTLSPHTIVYPAHDYKGFTSSTIGEEMTLNPRLTKDKEQFERIMAELNLPYPKKIDIAQPANMRCGL